MDLDRAVDILGDAAGELARRQLPLPAQLQDAPAQRAGSAQLTASTTTEMRPSQTLCIMMKNSAVRAWPPRKAG